MKPTVSKVKRENHIHHVSRQWLNNPSHHTVAAVLFSATYWIRRAGRPVLENLDLTIADCSRKITLELNHDTEEERTNSIQKLKVLIAHAELALTYLETEIEP